MHVQPLALSPSFSRFNDFLRSCVPLNVSAKLNKRAKGLAHRCSVSKGTRASTPDDSEQHTQRTLWQGTCIYENHRSSFWPCCCSDWPSKVPMGKASPAQTLPLYQALLGAVPFFSPACPATILIVQPAASTM